MNRDYPEATQESVYAAEKRAAANVLNKAVGLATGPCIDPYSAGLAEGRRQAIEDMTPKPDANLSFKTSTTEVKALRDVNGNFLAAVRRVGPGQFGIETASYQTLTAKSVAEVAIFLTNAAAEMSEEEELLVQTREDTDSSDDSPAPKRTMSAATRAMIAATMKRKRAEQLKATKKTKPAKKKARR